MNILSKLEQAAIQRNCGTTRNYLNCSLVGFKMAINAPGWPCGKLFEVKGSPDLAKFYFCLQALKDSDFKGMGCWLIDCDALIDKEGLEQFGINTKDLWFSQPNNSEETFSLLLKVLEYNVIDVIVINSILSLFSLVYDYQWFRKKLNKLNAALKKTKTSVFVINPYDNRRYDLLGEYSTIILNIKRKRSLKIDDKFCGYFIDGVVEKNTFNLKYGSFKCKYLESKGIVDI